MKVKELIAELEKCDGNLPVVYEEVGCRLTNVEVVVPSDELDEDLEKSQMKVVLTTEDSWRAKK